MRNEADMLDNANRNPYVFVRIGFEDTSYTDPIIKRIAGYGDPVARRWYSKYICQRSASSRLAFRLFNYPNFTARGVASSEDWNISGAPGIRSAIPRVAVANGSGSGCVRRNYASAMRRKGRAREDGGTDECSARPSKKSQLHLSQCYPLSLLLRHLLLHACHATHRDLAPPSCARVRSRDNEG